MRRRANPRDRYGVPGFRATCSDGTQICMSFRRWSRLSTSVANRRRHAPARGAAAFHHLPVTSHPRPPTESTVPIVDRGRLQRDASELPSNQTLSTAGLSPRCTIETR
ncbi:hypothetical protein JMJ77_0001717 [Colletotrichum scovillei]|uniref:Uncharacterized protein n=1 Tax=Colletotrichum scovillei TaxID=1209932 RepID=A0A9P7R7N7_9PEZI|nr:hypothetical protein JMJ77_0001717 [Colletotrichum scovillei]KAG7070125.1 hypothetical protein JMJ76_0001382 [Colletotrichum scovillei]KAG7078373.1 hypothetical protein JMJ78_0002045 [Colletotrichum scovillei]